MSPENVSHGIKYLLRTLTPREREVVNWLCEAKTNWAIGQILGCKEGTVKKHLQRVYRKLGVETRMELLVFVGVGTASATSGVTT
jgi:DNA-binding CsgD family transcriptional regulator